MRSGPTYSAYRDVIKDLCDTLNYELALRNCEPAILHAATNQEKAEIYELRADIPGCPTQTIYDSYNTALACLKEQDGSHAGDTQQQQRRVSIKLGKAYYNSSDFQKASEIFSAYDNGSTEPEFLSCFTHTLFKLGLNTQEAALTLSDRYMQSQIEPPAQAFSVRACILFNLRRYSEAEPCYLNAIQRSDNATDISRIETNAAENYHAMENYSEAEKYFKRALEKNPQNKRAQLLYSEILIKLERDQEALALCDKVIENSDNNTPDNTQAYKLKFKLRFKRGEYLAVAHTIFQHPPLGTLEDYGNALIEGYRLSAARVEFLRVTLAASIQRWQAEHRPTDTPPAKLLTLPHPDSNILDFSDAQIRYQADNLNDALAAALPKYRSLTKLNLSYQAPPSTLLLDAINGSDITTLILNSVGLRPETVSLLTTHLARPDCKLVTLSLDNDGRGSVYSVHFYQHGYDNNDLSRENKLSEQNLSELAAALKVNRSLTDLSIKKIVEPPNLSLMRRGYLEIIASLPRNKTLRHLSITCEGHIPLSFMIRTPGNKIARALLAHRTLCSLQLGLVLFSPEIQQAIDAKYADNLVRRKKSDAFSAAVVIAIAFIRAADAQHPLRYSVFSLIKNNLQKLLPDLLENNRSLDKFSNSKYFKEQTYDQQKADQVSARALIRLRSAAGAAASAAAASGSDPSATPASQLPQPKNLPL